MDTVSGSLVSSSGSKSESEVSAATTLALSVVSLRVVTTAATRDSPTAALATLEPSEELAPR